MMDTKELSNLLLHYGRVITDEEFVEHTMFTRIRVIAYNGRLFYHKSINGNVYCFELK